MCTLLFAYKAHPEYDFIFIGNRDEFKNRPSIGAHFLSSHPKVLAGIDQEKGGTWTGITADGRIAFITNHRNLSLRRESSLSRGYLTLDFLIDTISPEDYLKKIQKHYAEYNPFNLVVGTVQELWFYSNIENVIKPLTAGIYGLSNAVLDTPWYKVTKAKKRFTELISKNFSIDELFEILADTEVPSDEHLPETGVPLETERMLSTIHIDSPNYGTLFKTVILVNKQGEVSFYEKQLRKDCWHSSDYSYVLENFIIKT